jgi:hypothetical protein
MENNTFEDISVISQPKELNIRLYQHQLASIYEMEKREKEQYIVDGHTCINTNISINADSPGYGKTLSMVTLVYRDKMEWDCSLQYKQSNISSYAGGRIKKTSNIFYDKLDVTLVLVSQSIIDQWYQECQKTPLSVKMITSNKLVNTVFIENYDVILVIPSMYNRLVSKYSGMVWKRFIFDEPGHLKVPSMTKILAGFIWMVTGTPNDITEKHIRCGASFMRDLFLYKGLIPFEEEFDYMIIKNSDEFIQYSYTSPPVNHIYHKCYNPMYKVTSGLVTPIITQMISAGNIQGAIKALGVGETQNIAELVRKKKNDELIELNSLLEIYKIKNKKNKIEIVLERIKRVHIQLTELNVRYKEILEGDCSICCSKISNPVMEPNCQNIFCAECILMWMGTKNTCPLCRDSIRADQLIYINTDNVKPKKPTMVEEKTKTKNDTIVSLVKRNKNSRFIIFSAWDQTFSPIRNHLITNDISFIEVKGSINQRKQNIDSFKNGDTQVIFLNSRFNGAGINLQEATDIIVYHNMNKSNLNQIIGRANRIGRTEPLNVHYLEI